MDNLHMELMKALEKEHKEAVNVDKYCKWWQEEGEKNVQLQQQKKQDSDNLIALAKLVDDKDNELAEKYERIKTLEAVLSEREKVITKLEEQNNPRFSADDDMCVAIPKV